MDYIFTWHYEGPQKHVQKMKKPKVDDLRCHQIPCQEEQYMFLDKEGIVHFDDDGNDGDGDDMNMTIVSPKQMGRCY